MKLTSLTLTGIGPFRGTERVDFAALSRSGLFLIEGPTGAGKSTIIDAIVFALYGAVSGRATSTDRIRSDLCSYDDPTEVVLEFEIGGVPHRITRSPSYERTKSRGTGITTEKARQLLEVLDGSVPAMKDAREIGTYIRERLGLSADHFRQLVVLPQGEFDALLRANPKQRFEVLGNLIDDGFLARVQEDLRRRADEAAAERDAALGDAADLLGHLRERAREFDGSLVPDDDAPFDEPAVDQVRAEIAGRVERSREVLTDHEDQAEAARTTATLAEQSLTQARAAATAVSRLSAARMAAAEIDPDWAVSSTEELRAVQSHVSARQARLEPLARWEDAEPQRQARARSLDEATRRATEHLASLRDKATTLPQRIQEAELLLEQATKAAAELPNAAAEVERVQALRTSAAALESARQSLDSARSAEAKAADVLASARTALHVARTAESDALRAQLDQRAAHLARSLAAGEPCPVCGATEHPLPAISRDDDLITDEDLALLEAASVRASEAEAEAVAHHGRAREEVESATARVADARALLGDVDPATLDQRLADARAVLQSTRQAADQLAQAQSLCDALAQESTELAARIESAIAAESAARVEQRAAADQVAAEHAALIDQVGDDTTASALLAALTPRARVLEELLAAHEAAASVAATLDPVDAGRLHEEAQARRASAESALSVAQLAHSRAVEAQRAIDTLADRWTAARAAAADVIARTEPVIELGDLVSARSAANIRRTTLQSYAVQRRFTAVLQAASAHLERMSSGHYAFELDAEASRGQAGLGITMRDLWTGRDRDPATLSGGETFYASLSLALGLADVVREENGGVDLNTLFVDEGFGSLDQESLQLVLDQLDALRSRGRVVGVISHVTEMKEWVHDRVEVVPGPPLAGSHIRQAAERPVP